ncbi:MAG: epoxyqueuosine reductase [Clostridiales bacterium]|nr:epoxyqueuosine reductase [Eubacteriales bacterium]MDH7566718.1 epoxyqueuosine reductase [Clostridiales bacterium]
MEDRIKEIFMELGADICGIANIERFTDAPSGFHPADIYEECKSVVVFAKCMPKGLAWVSPRNVYIKATDTNLNELDRISYLGSIEIEKLGGIAVPMPSDSPYEYWDSDNLEGRGLLSMKHAALLAGIGSMGKNTLIINKKYGNMLNMGAVLTNLDLKSDPFSEKMCIDGCRLCLDSCPQKALDGQTANQKLCREYTYGNNKRGFPVCNCNKCRVVCPRSLGER